MGDNQSSLALGGTQQVSSADISARKGMTRRHFVSHDDRPQHLGDVDLIEIDPALRSLLFTDGTVTRMLEAQSLSRVTVDVVAQSESSISEPVARYLEAQPGTDSVRRRVVIGTAASERPVIWAESHILPSRLPPHFLDVLEGAPDGIGESLQRVKLESWRDMLWFGLDSAPEWSTVIGESGVLTRLYRVITGGRPALLISESFAVDRRDDKFHLNCLT